MDTLTFIVVIVGIVVSLVFVILAIKVRNSLLGSFFKKSYGLMIAGAVIFTLGFATEFLEDIGIASGETAESVHHIFLIVAAAIFVLISLSFPKEVGRYMQDNQTK